MSGKKTIFVPVPVECMGIVIGIGGSNIKKIIRETRTWIVKNQGENGNSEEGTGFTVTGSAGGCRQAELAIRHCVENAAVQLTQDIPGEYVRLLTSRGDHHFRKIEENCDVKIFWRTSSSGMEEQVTVNIRGSVSNCERAQQILRENVKKWENDEANLAACSQQSKGTDVMEVLNEYMGIIVGSGRKNLDKIETKSGTKIKVFQGEDSSKIEITGPTSDHCARAKSLIKNHIMVIKDTDLRKKLGGEKRFVCLNCNVESDSKIFRLKPGESAPKLDGFIQGTRYRIETASTDDADGDDDDDISERTISEIKERLSMQLENLKELKKDQSVYIADLWCHFGKVLVCNVDEEEAQKTFSAKDIDRRRALIDENRDACWKFSFEEGVHPDDVTQSGLLEGSETRGGLSFKLIRRQWRYDFTFTTPSERNVRLKAWEGTDIEPPAEVKYILEEVFFSKEIKVKAWICYPSTSILRGDIITPNSNYDCRMKLRIGTRYVTDKESHCNEEDRILSEYLSNCRYDEANHKLDLPEEKIPEGFDCIFYREAKENIFEVTVDGECFTVIVYDRRGWDSDQSGQRNKEEFGIRVVMDSWSEALLSTEKPLNVTEIVNKLENYMEFLSALKVYLFNYN